MTVTKFVASPDLLEPVKPVVGTKKYPWRDLEVGEAFGVEPGTANWKTISTVCYKWSKKLGRKFRARKAPDGWIAVVRLPDSNVGTQAQVIEPVNAAPVFFGEETK